jgi:hypothetical protein
MILKWKKVRAGVYSATSPWGLYSIDGGGAGRNRWTVTYPDGDYGMVDALAEAKAWAEQHAETQQSKRGHSTRRLLQPNADGTWQVWIHYATGAEPRRTSRYHGSKSAAQREAREYLGADARAIFLVSPVGRVEWIKEYVGKP